MPKGRSATGSLPGLPTDTKPSTWSLHGPDGPIALSACGLVVGRSSICDVVLPDPDISRRHLRLSLIQGEPWAIDLGSVNGLLVDGISTRRARLSDGSTLWLGETCLTVRREPAALPASLLEAWSNLATSPAQALRDLAAAQSCSLEPDGTCTLHWESDTGRDDLGPLRRALLEAAMEWLAGGSGRERPLGVTK